jgi:hypothetical protein
MNAAAGSQLPGNIHDLLCLLCRLIPCGQGPGPIPFSGMTTLSLSSLQSAGSAIMAAAQAPAGAVALSHMHVTATGGQLYSTAVVTGDQIRIPLRGSIFGIPYDLELLITLDLKGGQVKVKLVVREPIKFEHEWVFKLRDLVAVGGGFFASGIELELAASVAAKGIDFLCIIKCGGMKILPVLLECLPTLIGGPQAYLACVAAKAGTIAAQIAECIATNCIK